MNVGEIQKIIHDGMLANDKPKVPVVLPGTPLSVLPCVVLAPSDDALGEGNRSLRYGFDITVVVPRNTQVSQYELLVELEVIVIQSLIPSGVRFDGPIVFASTGGADTGEPPALSRIIPVSFASDAAIC